MSLAARILRLERFSRQQEIAALIERLEAQVERWAAMPQGPTAQAERERLLSELARLRREQVRLQLTPRTF